MSVAVATCPRCEAELELPYLCEGCGELLRDPPGGLNAFERFGLPVRYELEREELEARYLRLSRRLHPDKQIGKPAARQSRALILSSALNEAYSLLRDPRQRAEHLLVSSGGKTADQDKSTPAAFLMEQMELREELEAAQAKQDSAALANFSERAQREQGACYEALKGIFADPAFPTDALLKQAREQLNVLKYWLTFAKDLAK
ncbi:MAG TPA: Fe-S protein assembly co-chaperone HscB [Planctomycetes bacterium]|nr:Fe-S protein assembly co-chaperone HscB [Planctomycetota bacterium]